MYTEVEMNYTPPQQAACLNNSDQYCLLNMDYMIIFMIWLFCLIHMAGDDIRMLTEPAVETHYKAYTFVIYL